MVDDLLKVHVGDQPGDGDDALVLGTAEAVELFRGHGIDGHLRGLGQAADLRYVVPRCIAEHEDPFDLASVAQGFQHGLSSDDQGGSAHGLTC